MTNDNQDAVRRDFKAAKRSLQFMLAAVEGDFDDWPYTPEELLEKFAAEAADFQQRIANVQRFVAASLLEGCKAMAAEAE